MSEDIRKEPEEALRADRDNAMAIVEAMDELDEEMWGEPPEEE